MAFRGRGRGRGGFGGGGFRAAKQEPFELFPEIEDLGKAVGVNEKRSLAVWYSKLQKYWNSSPYYYEDNNESSKKVRRTEIERYSERNSERTKPKPPLSHFIRMDPEYMPGELAKGEKEKRTGKRVRWNPESGLHKLDLFEEREQKHQKDDIKKSKEGEDEEEGDEINEEEEEEEFSDDGDYNQNIDFDDDEDDFNMGDDNDDEPIY